VRPYPRREPPSLHHRRDRRAAPGPRSRDFDSPSIVSGKSFELRFRQPGVYEYRDRDNPLLTGTVIVAAGFVRGKPHYPNPAGPRLVTHRWRASLQRRVQPRRQTGDPGWEVESIPDPALPRDDRLEEL
jgi:hypothetical protein